MTESGIIGMTWAGMAATKLRRFRFRSGVKDSKWVEDIPAKHKNVDDIIIGHSDWKQFMRSNANYFFSNELFVSHFGQHKLWFFIFLFYCSYTAL